MNRYGQLQGKTLIWERNDAKYPWITIGRDLKFEKHVQKLYNKSSQNLSALSRIAKSLSLNKKRTIFKVFVESQTKYYAIFS